MDHQGTFRADDDVIEGAAGRSANGPHLPRRARARRARPRRDLPGGAELRAAAGAHQDGASGRFDPASAAVAFAAAFAAPQIMTGPMVFLDEEPELRLEPLPGL
jgi:hypothetical protein